MAKFIGITTPKDKQESVESFKQKMDSLGVEKVTNDIFRNKQRTSTKSGILKSEAVLRFASALRKTGVNFFQDISKVVLDEKFEKEIMNIPGQMSGLSLGYFFMLSGSKSFEELLMSLLVQQEALTRLLVERGIFTKEEFLGMVKAVDQTMKRKRKGVS